MIAIVLCFRQCTGVTQISECSREQLVDTNQLSLNIQSILPQLKSLQNNQEIRIKSLQKSYREHEQIVIEQMRQMINSMLGKSEKEHEQEELSLKIHLVVADFEKSALKEITNEVTFVKDSIARSITKCTRLQNDLSQLHDSIQKIGDNKELCFIACMKCEQKLQQALTDLGKAGNVFTVKGKSAHTVKISNDSHLCTITACCALQDGRVLVLDESNKKVKLVDQQYQVVSQCDVTAYPLDMCLTTSNEVAVAVDNIIDTHEIQFIEVNQHQLQTGRKLQFQHKCICVAHNQGDLFICSYTALYKYSLGGKLVSRLFVDPSGCAVSPIGDKLYIVDHFKHKLLTLASDGTVLATLTDPGLRGPSCVHVTPAGQVLVCGHKSRTIVQVDSKNSRKLITLATAMDDVWNPFSVCYSSTSSSFIVGQWRNNTILVIKVE
ncbi:uncharacterized protein LOC127839871 [Dreissena polymorpha]|uniref:uncharacterized protein LOC127839871 n=1 Tax=Dreissena polymorpha TaxID=45954 RepID=UPI0022651E17|nr:uncharacterized protein LOC127839871 [Dreissena polymorpha]